MLHFGLKVVWFCLSLSGLICCWATMLAFGCVLGAYELPVVYAIGCTFLQGSFCLGLIWKMDPFLMPKAFCIAQSTFIGLGTFLVTGVAASVSIATSLTVLKPKTWGDQGKSTLAWRYQYFLLVLVFPLMASAVQLAVTLHYRWPVYRQDDFHCDYAGPLTWLRFLSYAGPPLVVSIPCFFLSTISIYRILKVYQHLRRARKSDMDIDTILAKRQNNTYLARAISTPPPLSQPSTRREPISPALNNPNVAAQKFHMPFSPPPSLDDPNATSFASSSTTDPPDSPVSSDFPTFADPPEGGTFSINPDGISIMEDLSHPNEDWRAILNGSYSRSSDSIKSTYRWREEDGKSEFEYGKCVEHEDEDCNSVQSIPPHLPRVPRGMGRRPKQPPSLAPAIWRMILFQFGFVTFEVLACISSLIAVTTKRPPSVFGTQHVSLILAAWGPVLIFGHLSAVREALLSRLPWKRRST